MNSYSTKIFIRKNGDSEDNTKIVKLNTKLPGEEYTIGWVDGCDIQLSNDTGYMSKLHCTLTKEAVGWAIVDTSTNGTILIGENHKTELQTLQKVYLSDQDVIIIEDWHLTFSEPAKTKRKHSIPLKRQCSWVFNIGERALYKVENGKRIRVKISPQIKKMLHYMASQNLAHNNSPKICPHDELIQAIWGEEDFGITKEHLRLLAQKVRNILTLDKDNKDERQKWLETINNEGYILNVDCEH
ncbi:FHA domain-containing protein [Synechocystis sp. CACIAM 05]|uniref:FHA domain-containing protein n=1 Tax=Synechocystis sp. CACIAM 05 TaxID=1933929 RepID=UPI00138E74A8|nr:FHA domain-containing protein [Synechocystis sp. CACIAM 05]QHU98788.1 hypothetical protein BWK47_00660 [Synechocystis sp. CACIAM 05]